MVLEINKLIDKVVSIEVTKVPDSALYFVFVFGERAVSISGVTPTEKRHFGEKEFETGVSFVELVSQATDSLSGNFEITFLLGGTESA